MRTDTKRMRIQNCSADCMHIFLQQFYYRKAELNEKNYLQYYYHLHCVYSWSALILFFDVYCTWQFRIVTGSGYGVCGKYSIDSFILRKVRHEYK